MNKEYFNELYKKDPYHWELKDGRIHQFDQNIITLLKPYKDKHIKLIDLGCGSGRTLKLIYNKNWDIYGLDFSEQAYKLCMKKIPEIKFILSNILYNPLKSKYFDIVLGIGSFEHLEIISFKEPYRILKDGGIFICVLPSIKDKEVNCHNYTQNEWTKLLERDGFKVLMYMQDWTYLCKKEKI